MLTVSCPGCNARYRLTDEQIAGRARVKLRCTRCQRVFEAEIPTVGSSSVANPPTAAPTTSPLGAGPRAPAGLGPIDTGSGFDNLFDERAELSALSREEEKPSMSFAGDLFDQPMGGAPAPAKLTAAMAPAGAPVARAGSVAPFGAVFGGRGEPAARPQPPAPSPATSPFGTPAAAMPPRSTAIESPFGEPPVPSPFADAPGGFGAPAAPRRTLAMEVPERDALGNFDFGDERASPPGGGQGVDPMVEFHDVFRDAKGDDGEQARRYSKSDMFEAAGNAAGTLNLASTGADVSREASAPRATTRSSAIDPPGPPSSERAATSNPDDDIVQKALASSSEREPSAEKAVANTAGTSGITPLDLSGGRSGAGLERLDPGPRLLGTALALVTSLVIGAGWVAVQNDGVLDLSDPVGSIEAALGGVDAPEGLPDAPDPVVRETQGNVDGAPLPRIGELVVSRYVTEAGVSFVVVDGHVSIPAGSSYRRLDLDVQAWLDGRMLTSRRARAGAALDSLALERSSEGSGLETRYASAVAAASDLTFGGGQQPVFRAVFDASDVPEGALFRASLASAHRAVEEACWTEITWGEAEGSGEPTE